MHCITPMACVTLRTHKPLKLKQHCVRAALHNDGMCCTPHLQAPHHQNRIKQHCMRAALHTDGMCCTPHLQAPHHRNQKMKATLYACCNTHRWHVLHSPPTSSSPPRSKDESNASPHCVTTMAYLWRFWTSAATTSDGNASLLNHIESNPLVGRLYHFYGPVPVGKDSMFHKPHLECTGFNTNSQAAVDCPKQSPPKWAMTIHTQTHTQTHTHTFLSTAG